MLCGDFERYERDYLKRSAVGNRLDPEEQRRMEQIETARKAAAEAALDSWDWVVLEMIRREDPRTAMKIGTVRTTESFLKLFCHGLIAKLDRQPTFDELERIQAFLDSAEYKQYEDRLKKLMTKEVGERLKVVFEITGIRGQEDMWDLTDEGRRRLQAKRAEIIALHGRMTKQYEESRTDFYEDALSYAWALPMMVLMGLGAGAMMSYAYSVADASFVLGGAGGAAHEGLFGADFDPGFDF